MSTRTVEPSHAARCVLTSGNRSRTVFMANAGRVHV